MTVQNFIFGNAFKFTSSKESPMMNNHTTANEVMNLIDLAQHNKNGKESSEAINKLWDIFGDKVTGITIKKSFSHDSDHSMHGMSVYERRNHLQEQAFDTFRNAVLAYDASTNVPFMAYVSKKINWQQLDFKRKNAKHTHNEKATDFSIEGGSSISMDDPKNAEMLETMNHIDLESPMASRFVEDFEKQAYLDDMVHVLFGKLQNEKKLLEFATTYYEVCQEEDKDTDAEVAKRMGCTRSYASQLHKKLIAFLSNTDFADDCRMALAA